MSRERRKKLGVAMPMSQLETNHHPSTQYLAAAFAFVFDEKQRLLLLSEHKDRRKYMWDLPGGTLTDEEGPIDGLRREVYEETGLQLRLLSPLCWLKWDRHESGRPILVAFYVAETSTDEVSLSEEHSGFRWVSMKEFEWEKLEVSAGPEIVEESFAQYRRSTGVDG
jgi:8-oxo-dGTP pyrophosphatase MutT (NUDIX family)